MFGYLFPIKGPITKIKLSATTSENINPSCLGPEYEDEPSLCMKGLPDDFFLMMHEDNDGFKTYQKSDLPINISLQKYFPNSPFKGNILLVKVDEDDNIVGGKWTHRVLKKYKLGYIAGQKVNDPIAIPKEDGKLSKVPIVEKKTPETSATSVKKCKKCGFPQGFWHVNECRINQTNTIINKVNDLLETHPELNKYSKDRSAELRAGLNTSWKKFIKFANLRKVGLNQTGLNWINFYLKLFDHVSDVIKIETPLEHKTIIDGIFAVLYCYDHNSQLDFNADACPDCKKDFEECCKSRNTYPELINQWLEDLEYSDISKFKKMKMLYPHLTINIFNQLFHQLNCNFSEKTEEERDSTEPIILGMIFSWATLLVEEYTFSKLMSEVDKELFG